MKIFVVSAGSYVQGASASRSATEALARTQGLKYEEATESEFRPDELNHSGRVKAREFLYYKSGRTGRWNKTDYTITTLIMGPGDN